MLDLYLVLLPTYAIITIINIIYLKLSIRDNMMAIELAEKNISSQNIGRQLE